ncbi:hypothetical protein HAX54_007920, partial [Datura stramonium]|nr:hypothetical protein [Datura stramonium]
DVSVYVLRVPRAWNMGEDSTVEHLDALSRKQEFRARGRCYGAASPHFPVQQASRGILYPRRVHLYRNFIILKSKCYQIASNYKFFLGNDFRIYEERIYKVESLKLAQFDGLYGVEAATQGAKDNHEVPMGLCVLIGQYEVASDYIEARAI